MNASNIKNILDLALISYDFTLSHIWGSEYWNIQGVKYRVADHSKPSGQKFNGVDLRNHTELIDALKTNNVNITDKATLEVEFKARSFNFETKEDATYGTLYITPDHTMYDNKNDAIDYLWAQEVKRINSVNQCSGF